MEPTPKPKTAQRTFRSASDMFKSTAPAGTDGLGVTAAKSNATVPINKLVPFSAHPFKLYEGQRLDDMVRSVSELGVIFPVIVRPKDGKLEILSGHNRVNAAQLAGLSEVPAIIKEGLTDDEATLIVTETNLVQRSFSDLSHSERAIALKHHLDALKAQGKRSDLLNEIKILSENSEKSTENLQENSYGSKGNLTSPQIGEKLLSVEETGDKYGLSKNSVARYIRLTFLNTGLLKMVDSEAIPMTAAVEVSYLSDSQQGALLEALSDGTYKLDMKKAATLRTLSDEGRLTPIRTVQVLSGELDAKKSKAPPIKIKPAIYAKYFTPDTKAKDVEATIDKALALYFQTQEQNAELESEEELESDSEDEMEM